jgi:hypothetical protein
MVRALSPSHSYLLSFQIGETVTWTKTDGPLPCAESITCTCVLPTATVKPTGETTSLGPKPTITPPELSNKGDKVEMFVGAQGVAGMIFAAAAAFF